MRSEIGKYALLKQDLHSYRAAILIGLLGLVAIIVVDELALRSLPALSLAAHLMRTLPLVLIAIAIGWRISELVLFRKFGDAWVAEALGSPILISILCLLSIFFCTWAVLAIQIGVIPPGGVTDWEGAVGGGFPMADARQFLAGAFNMAQRASMSALVVRRPVNGVVLSNLMLIADFHRLVVVFLQSALVGASMTYLCLNLARFAGIAVGIATWATLYLLVIDYLPAYLMSEPMGMWIGFFGLGLLLSGFLRAAPIPLAIGTGMLFLGFTARPGAMFLVPAFFLAGLWLFRRNRRDILLFSGLSAICIAIGLAVPTLSYLVYGSGSKDFLGNLPYFVYQLTAGSTDWRQITYDYPGGHTAAFIYQKAFENFWNHPFTLVETYFKIGYLSVRDIPTVLFREFARSLGITQATCAEDHFCKIFYPFLFYRTFPSLLFGAGLLSLVAWPGWSRRWRVAVIGLTIAYVASLPVIWLDLNIRTQATTFALLCFVMSGVLARPVRLTSPLARESSSELVGAVVFALILIGIYVPALHAAVVRVHLPKLTATASGESQAYLTFGPYTPVLRFVDKPGPTIRPEVPLSEFIESSRVQVQPEYYAHFAAGQQIVMGFSARNNSSKGYVSRTFCIPDRNWIFIATLGREFPPGFFEIKSLVPADWHGKPLPSDAPLPFGCLYGQNPARF